MEKRTQDHGVWYWMWIFEAAPPCLCFTTALSANKPWYYCAFPVHDLDLSTFSGPAGGPVVLHVSVSVSLKLYAVCAQRSRSRRSSFPSLLLPEHTAAVGSDPALIRYPFLLVASSCGNPVLCNAMLNKTFPYVHYPELKTRSFQRLRRQSVTERLGAVR